MSIKTLTETDLNWSERERFLSPYNSVEDVKTEVEKLLIGKKVKVSKQPSYESGDFEITVYDVVYDGKGWRDIATRTYFTNGLGGGHESLQDKIEELNSRLLDITKELREPEG